MAGVGPLEEAFVEITSDPSRAEAGINEVGVALEGVERTAREVGEGIEDAFREAGEGVERSFEEAGRSVDDTLDATARDAQLTGSRIGDRVTLKPYCVLSDAVVEAAR